MLNIHILYIIIYNYIIIYIIYVDYRTSTQRRTWCETEINHILFKSV